MSGLERLNLGGETRIVDPVALGQYAAVRLFIERAVAVRPGFAVTNENAPAVAAISARLHGMPLAIELAAARIKILSPEAILARLDQQLDVLAAGSRDLPARQQTLRGAIAWSYDLLDDGGRRLLDRLSVFASGCDLAAAEAICGPSSELGGDILDGLMALVDQSLLKVDEIADGEPRFRLLDTIRAFAAERLEADGEVDIDPGAPSRLVRRPRRAGGAASWPAPTSAAGSTASSSNTTTSAPSSTGRSPRRTRRSRSAWPSRCGASGRSTAISPRRAAGSRRWRPRRGRATIRGCAPSSSRRSAGRAGGRASCAEMATRYREALALWQALGDEAELANAYYNASFTFAVPTRGRRGR